MQILTNTAIKVSVHKGVTRLGMQCIQVINKNDLWQVCKSEKLLVYTVFSNVSKCVQEYESFQVCTSLVSIWSI